MTRKPTRDTWQEQQEKTGTAGDAINSNGTCFSLLVKCLMNVPISSRVFLMAASRLGYAGRL